MIPNVRKKKFLAFLNNNPFIEPELFSLKISSNTCKKGVKGSCLEQMGLEEGNKSPMAFDIYNFTFLGLFFFFILSLCLKGLSAGQCCMGFGLLLKTHSKMWGGISWHCNDSFALLPL